VIRMKAGFAKREITPSLPAEMGGYAARTGMAKNVHRPLYCRTMAGWEEGLPFAAVALDLLGVDLRLREETCLYAASVCGVPRERISLIASHTHCAVDGVPDVLRKGLWTRQTSHVPREYRELLVRVIAESIAEALERAEDVRLQWHRSECEGIAGNRRDRDQEADPSVHVLTAVSRRTGQTIGGLVHFACHPTVIGPSHGSVSPDFPGALLDLLESRYSGGVFLYANGAAGDVSCRYTRKSPDPEEADRMGKLLFSSLEKMVSLEAPASSPSYASTAVSFCYRDALDGSLGETWLQQLTIAGQRLWLVPGEAFSSSAKAAGLMDPQTLIVGYANDYIGYLPDEPAWAEGGYEVEVSRLTADEVGRLWRTFLSIENDEHQSGGSNGIESHY
jgi:hypothetical protein